MMMEAENCVGEGMVSDALGFPGTPNVAVWLRENGWGSEIYGKIGGMACFPA